MRRTPLFLSFLLLLGGIFINAKVESRNTEPEVSLFNKKGINTKPGNISVQEINNLKKGDQILKVVLNGKSLNITHLTIGLKINKPNGDFIESANSNSLDDLELEHLKTMQKGDFIICVDINYIKPDGTSGTTKIKPVVSVL